MVTTTENPFFSIIVPVYQVAPWLRAALRSLLHQTFTSWECIAVDDESRDASSEILAAFCRADHRIRMISQPHAGVSCARNRALARARGKYICFMDGDDCFYPWALQAFYDVIQQTNADLVRSRFPAYRPYLQKRNPKDTAFTHYTEKKEVLTWGWQTFCAGGYAWTFAVRRSTLDTLRFPEQIALKEDVIFALNLLSKCRTAVQMDEIVYWYRRRKGSAVRHVTTPSSALMRIESYERLATQQLDLYPEDVSATHPLTRLLMEEFEECALSLDSALLPEVIHRLRGSGILALECVPWCKRQMIHLAERGLLWPIVMRARWRHAVWRFLQLLHSWVRWLLDHTVIRNRLTYGEERVTITDQLHL
ncbi:MAG: glycosyltransferase family 2 protein [Kiritimatiellae bacterium]|nr:glycosyltransferase family 2 protein [Kiritimatiellia bacterium]